MMVETSNSSIGELINLDQMQKIQVTRPMSKNTDQKQLNQMIGNARKKMKRQNLELNKLYMFDFLNVRIELNKVYKS